MKAIKLIAAVTLTLVFGILKANLPVPKGWWKFNDTTNLLKAEAGCMAILQLVGSHQVAAGPESGNGAVVIGPGSYYKMQHLINNQNGENQVNEYSLLFDIKISAASEWHALFQTNTQNQNDGDFFINPAGNIGVSAVGYSGYNVNVNEWYRLIVAVKNPTLFTVYLDGHVLLEGNPQAVDDRFSLDKWLLIFADENGEDGMINCAELAIWDKYLTEENAKGLGGYGHNVRSCEMALVPYLQSPGINSMVICWHDTVKSTPTILYGTTSNCGKQLTATSEKIKYNYYWNTATLNGLSANTNYYYQLTNGKDTSPVYEFKTLPDTTYKGKLRFLILGDTHSSDTTMPVKILKEARSKLTQLYGANYYDSVQAIIHTGDIVVDGNSVDLYSTQYFKPMSPLSGNFATMVVAGNHEGENPYFYRYMKLDSYSAFPANANLNEKVWRFRVGNTLYLGLNTNITASYGYMMKKWLNEQLSEAETNPSIDFVFLVMHHPPFSELWYDVVNFDGGPNYVVNTLFPIIKKYTKVQQIHYGHTHGFERGTICSDQPDGDFRIICGGGSGGPLDPWTEGAVHDYHDIHKTYSEYFFQLVEVDIAHHSYQNSVFSLGNPTHPKSLTVIDSWYKKLEQPKPSTPYIETVTKFEDKLQLTLSRFSGVDSLMSVQIKFVDGNKENQLILDTVFHWQNIYGIDNEGYPVNKNALQNLLTPEIAIQKLPTTKNIQIQVRYRDHNLKWSDWSPVFIYDALGIHQPKLPENSVYLGQNSPNPFHNITTINYNLPQNSKVKLQFFNQRNQLISAINVGFQPSGNHTAMFNGVGLEPGMYYYQLIANNNTVTKAMIKL